MSEKNPLGVLPAVGTCSVFDDCGISSVSMNFALSQRAITNFIILYPKWSAGGVHATG